MKRIILFLIIGLLLLSIVSSQKASEDGEKESLEKPTANLPKVKLGDLEPKTLTKDEETKLEAYADSLWKVQQNYTTFEVKSYRQYGNTVIIYAEVDGKTIKWLKNNETFVAVKK